MRDTARPYWKYNGISNIVRTHIYAGEERSEGKRGLTSRDHDNARSEKLEERHAEVAAMRLYVALSEMRNTPVSRPLTQARACERRDLREYIIKHIPNAKTESAQMIYLLRDSNWSGGSMLLHLITLIGQVSKRSNKSWKKRERDKVREPYMYMYIPPHKRYRYRSLL